MGFRALWAGPTGRLARRMTLLCATLRRSERGLMSHGSKSISSSDCHSERQEPVNIAIYELIAIERKSNSLASPVRCNGSETPEPLSSAGGSRAR